MIAKTCMGLMCTSTSRRSSTSRSTTKRSRRSTAIVAFTQPMTTPNTQQEKAMAEDQGVTRRGILQLIGFGAVSAALVRQTKANVLAPAEEPDDAAAAFDTE